MPLKAKVAPLIEGRRRGLVISDLIEQTRAKNPQIAQAFTTIQNTVNDMLQSMAKPASVTEFTVTDPVTGKQIAWIGGVEKGGKSYSGAAFANLWVGPNADPATAPFFCDGSNVVIGKNGVVYVQDMAGNTGATFGVTQEPALAITAATNTAPSVVTIVAHGYINGDTVLIAGAAGNTAINGYRIVQGVTANTFTLTDPAGVATNGNGALSGAPTAIRYYAGVLAQVFAVGSSFAGYKLRAFADGTLRIKDATINLSSVNGSITIDPIIPAITVVGSAFTINLDSAVGFKVTKGVVTASTNISGVLEFVVANSVTGASGILNANGLWISDPTNGSVALLPNILQVSTAGGITSALTGAGFSLINGAAVFTGTRNMVASVSTISNAVRGTPGAGQSNVTVVTGVILTASTFSGGILASA